METTDRQGSFWSTLPDSKDNVSIINAHPFRRLFAFFIDMFIFKMVVFFVMLILVNFYLISPQSLWELFIFRTNLYEYGSYFTSARDIYIHIMLSGFFLGYFMVFESKRVWGATPGKRLLGIKVVDSRGDKVSFKKSLLRNCPKYLLRLPIIGIIFGFLEFFLIFSFSARTGDMLAGTLVADKVHKGTYTSGK